MESCLRHSYFWMVWNLQNVISGCLKYVLLFLSHAKLSWDSHFSEVWALTVSEFYQCSHYAGWGGPSQPRPPGKSLNVKFYEKARLFFRAWKKPKTNNKRHDGEQQSGMHVFPVCPLQVWYLAIKYVELRFRQPPTLPTGVALLAASLLAASWAPFLCRLFGQTWVEYTIFDEAIRQRR